MAATDPSPPSSSNSESAAPAKVSDALARFLFNSGQAQAEGAEPKASRSLRLDAAPALFFLDFLEDNLKALKTFAKASADLGPFTLRVAQARGRRSAQRELLVGTEAHNAWVRDFWREVGFVPTEADEGKRKGTAWALDPKSSLADPKEVEAALAHVVSLQKEISSAAIELRPMRKWKSIEKALSRSPSTIEEFLDLLFQLGPFGGAQDDRLRRDFRDFLREYKEEFITDILPCILKYARDLPTHFPSGRVPVLRVSSQDSITLKREAVASLLAHAFLCTHPSDPEADSGFALPPDLNWSPLYAHLHAPQEAAKLHCLLHYFRRINKQPPVGSVTYRRQALMTFPDFKASSKPLRPIAVREKGAIEESVRALQVDFANRFIGGGVIHGVPYLHRLGCVQEEIRFSIEPELLGSLFFCEAMLDHEALFLSGSECFSLYKGYAKSLQFGGDCVDQTPKTPEGEFDKELTAIDAIDYRGIGAEVQYKEEIFLREIKKSYVGFFQPPEDPRSAWPIATGNWGCGAFLGDREHKSLLQLLSASELGRDLVYYTFGDKKLSAGLERFNALAAEKGWTVGDLYAKLSAYEAALAEDSARDGVFAFVLGTEGEGGNCVIS